MIPLGLMGFGHRIYKNYDPLVTVMKQTCGEVLKEFESNDNILEVTKQLEHIAFNDLNFIEKNFIPIWISISSIALKAIGISTTMFKVILLLRIPLVGLFNVMKCMIKN